MGPLDLGLEILFRALQRALLATGGQAQGYQGQEDN